MVADAVNSKAILVVEDEALIRLWATDLLEENGFSVLEAKDADAALKILESRPDVKLLFTDVQMPGSLNGMELAREVHARWPHILLVITSGRERPTRRRVLKFRITAASWPNPTVRTNCSGRSMI
jgi:CheY-like chemotaxis protein